MHRAFTLSTLAKMDGGKNAVRFEEAMEQVIRNVCNSPGDTSARKVTMTITVKPSAGQEGVCDEVHTTCDFKVSLPPVKSRVYSMGASANGKAIVNDASLDNIRQMTIDQATGEVLEESD